MSMVWFLYLSFTICIAADKVLFLGVQNFFEWYDMANNMFLYFSYDTSIVVTLLYIH